MRTTQTTSIYFQIYSFGKLQISDFELSFDIQFSFQLMRLDLMRQMIRLKFKKLMNHG